MARTPSDQLYQLIHSLSTEEKGYFIKFAKRYSSTGNTNLELFLAIGRQKVFEEKELQKKFKAYAVTKAYLKNMILDSLTLYHRSHHPHIELLAQIQRVYVLLMRGMQVEAGRYLDKAIAEAEKMEAFALTRYLLQVRHMIQRKTVKGLEDLRKAHEEYTGKLQSIDTQQADLTDWENLSFEINLAMKGVDFHRPVEAAGKVKAVKKKTTASRKSELTKMRTLYHLHLMTMNEKELYAIAKGTADLASELRATMDASIDDVGSISNYLMTLGFYEKYNERLRGSEKLYEQPRHDITERHEVLIRYVLHKTSSLFSLGRFEEARSLLAMHDKEFMAAVAFTGDATKLDVFIQKKILASFLCKDYAATWRGIQIAGQMRGSFNANISYADMKMIELMCQHMMGNVELVRSLSRKYKKDFAGKQIQSQTYQVLFGFFDTRSPLHYRKEARKAMEQLEAYYAAEKKTHRKIFAIVRYTYWLEEIAGGKAINKNQEDYARGKG